MSTRDDERPLRLVTEQAQVDQVRHHDPARPVYGYEPADSPLTRASKARDRAERMETSYARHLADTYAADPDDPLLPAAADLYREQAAQLRHAEAVLEVELERSRARRAGTTAGDVV